MTKLASFVSTPKSLPRQLRPPRISAHYRLSFGSAFSVPSSSSQEEQVRLYLAEREQERRNLKTPNNAMAVISDGNCTPLSHYVDCKWERLSGASKEEFRMRADEVVSYVLNTIAPSQQEQLWEGVVKRYCSVEDKINNITVDLGLEAILWLSDNTSTAVEEAFKTIASIFENLGPYGAGATWTRDTLRS